MTMSGKFAETVELDDHHLVVDGEDFPWLVAPNPTVEQLRDDVYAVKVEIFPILAKDTSTDLTISVVGGAWVIPRIGDTTFPWLMTEDGYTIKAGKALRPTLTLAFLTRKFTDVRTVSADA